MSGTIAGRTGTDGLKMGGNAQVVVDVFAADYYYCEKRNGLENNECGFVMCRIMDEDVFVTTSVVRMIAAM